MEILRVAAGDGRLTTTELEERVAATLTARTRDEPAALTVDLLAVPVRAGSGAARAKDVVRLDYQGGNATRRGQWVVPAPVRRTVEVSGENRGGRVTARPPRRTFRQWFLRRPRPHARSFHD